MSITFAMTGVMDLVFALPSLYTGKFWLEKVAPANISEPWSESRAVAVPPPSSACRGVGVVVAVLTPMSLWSIAGLHTDRFISISHPLR